MDSENLRELLESVRSGRIDIEGAVDRLSRLPFLDTPHGRIDTHRALRQGIPEVVYGGEKTVEQIVDAASALRQAGQDVLVTRGRAREGGGGPRADCPLPTTTRSRARVDRRPTRSPIQGKGTILVISAGTADRPVAAEAVGVARCFGNKVELLQDVGVAGLHRLLASHETLRAARVLIVVAGMEGALPSVVGGLVDKPVIAVPTSVGYGASFGGIAALLGMLTSCASNVTVVNIDNGFGAALRRDPDQPALGDREARGAAGLADKARRGSHSSFISTAFSGIAGNMFLGALLDLGLPRKTLLEGLDPARLSTSSSS